MIATITTLGRWEIRTSPSTHRACDAVWICRMDPAQPEAPASAPELDEVAGDFITRHVLEKDSTFFEG